MSEVRYTPGPAHPITSPDAAYAAVQHPDEIIANLTLSAPEKREILASWASDERAVIGSPTLRQLPSGAIVRLYDIQRAMMSLDRKEASHHHGRLGARDTFRSRRGLARWLARRASSPWDDDDPPPQPIGMRPISSVA